MTQNKAKIPAALGRLRIALFGAAAAIVTLWAVADTAQGQALEMSGSEQPAAGRWQRLVNQPTILCDTALLLTDGRVMVHQYGDPNHNGQGMNNWWALTPDVNGSYLNGTWSQLASMSSSYGPLYFASAVLPDGRVIVEGGEYNFLNFTETNQGSIYDPVNNTWTSVNPPVGWSQIGDAPGAVLPNGNDMADAPCAVLANGDVLVATSPGVFQTPVTFFTFNGTTFTQAPATQTSTSLTSYQERFLLLPSGQVLSLVADGIHIDAELFTGQGPPDPAWRPNITSVPATLTGGTTVQISGTQFNGLSVGSDYGDDCTNATNYPLVRITNIATGHVFYARTHDHSTMAIATGNTVVSTMVDVPANAETGSSNIEVVANGIASRPRRVTIQ